jgi:hypothetical protein
MSNKGSKMTSIYLDCDSKKGNYHIQTEVMNLIAFWNDELDWNLLIKIDGSTYDLEPLENPVGNGYDYEQIFVKHTEFDLIKISGMLGHYPFDDIIRLFRAFDATHHHARKTLTQNSDGLEIEDF